MFVNTGQSLRPGYAPTMKAPQEPQRHDNQISSSQYWGNFPVPPAPSLGINGPENGPMASHALSDVERMGPTRRPTESVPETTADQEPSPAGFGEINYRTNGKEFYGPAATLAFLLELRSRAKAFQSQHQLSRLDPVDARIGSGRHQSSIVNFLDADDDVPLGMFVILKLTQCQHLYRLVGSQFFPCRYRTTSARRYLSRFPPGECASSCDNAFHHNLRKFRTQP